MPARRRRTGSEAESLIIVDDSNNWTNTKHNHNNQYPNNVPPDFYSEEDFVEPHIEPELIMTARDRTGEFVNTIQSLQGRNIARAVAVKDPKKSRFIQTHSEFMLIAKNIGKNIANTYVKLEKLTLRKCDSNLFEFYSNKFVF